MTEERPYVTLDPESLKCLACGIPMPTESPLACPDTDCGAGYFNDGMPVMEY